MRSCLIRPSSVRVSLEPAERGLCSLTAAIVSSNARTSTPLTVLSVVMLSVGGLVGALGNRTAPRFPLAPGRT
jgi:hypothetical protein